MEDSTLKNAIYINLLTIQQEAGIRTRYLESTTRLPHVRRGWATSVRSFLRDIGAKI